MLVYGAIFAVMTAVIFTLLGGSASRLSAWLRARPRAVRAVNVGAGATFVAAGLSVLALKQRAAA
jgi:threonine/homoserine/homoserine lactone efflux protein